MTRQLKAVNTGQENQTDQTVGQRKGMFGQHLHHVRLALLHLIGKPGTPHVLKHEAGNCSISRLAKIKHLHIFWVFLLLLLTKNAYKMLDDVF